MSLFRSTLMEPAKCLFEVLPITDPLELQTLCGVTLMGGRVLPYYEPILQSLQLHCRPIESNPMSAEFNNNMIKWKRQMRFVPNHVVQKTLQAVTRLRNLARSSAN